MKYRVAFTVRPGPYLLYTIPALQQLFVLSLAKTKALGSFQQDGLWIQECYSVLA